MAKLSALLKDIKLVGVAAGIIITLVASALGVERWLYSTFETKEASAEEFTETRTQVADLAQKMRMWEIEARMFAVEKRMWWLEERYGDKAANGNEGNRRDWKELNAEKLCLEHARATDNITAGSCKK